MSHQSFNPVAFDIEARVQSMRAEGDQFAIATVVRTISVTAAKPGAKAIINAEGEIVDGWIGGGCAKSAVIKAAIQSLKDGEPKLVSLQPEEFLEEQGLVSGEEANGVLAARNMCPSQGSMDIFIEPILCEPELLIIGASPVADMLARLAEPFAFNLKLACDDRMSVPMVNRDVLGFNELSDVHDHRYIIVATQGSGDEAALRTALGLQSRFVGFVGSKRKTQHLKNKLKHCGLSEAQVESIKGPTGLDIGGITPQEIALSILAELVKIRRSQAMPTMSKTISDS